MLEKLKGILCDYTDSVEQVPLTNETQLKEELGLDSFAFVSMFGEIENEFGIQVDNVDEIEELETVNDVLTYIEGKLA